MRWNREQETEWLCPPGTAADRWFHHPTLPAKGSAIGFLCSKMLVPQKHTADPLLAQRATSRLLEWHVGMSQVMKQIGKWNGWRKVRRATAKSTES